MADDNPYIGIVQQDAKSQLRRSIGQANTVNPDQESEIQRLGRVYGIPAQAIRQDPDRYKRQAQVDSIDYDAIVRSAPTTAGYLSNSDNAKIAHDDLDSMSSVETIVRGIGSRAANLAGGLGRAAFTAVDPLADRLNDITESVGLPTTVEWGPDGVKFRQRTDAERNMVGDELSQRLIKKGEATTFGYKPMTTWEDFKQQPLQNFLPFALEQGLVSIPDMAAALSALPAYIAARTGEIGQTRAENDKRTDATVGDLMIAAPGAIASSLLERLGARGILGLDDAARAFKEIPKAVGVAAAKEAATEAGQEALESAAETVGTAAGFDPAQTAERALAGAVGGAGFGGVARAATAPVQIAIERNQEQAQAAQAAEQNGEALAAFADAAAQSRLRERDPAAFERFVAEATASGPVSDVYVSAQALAQSGVDLEELATLLPSAQGQLAEALETGGDLRIPVSEFATFAAGTPLAQMLIPHLRVDPGMLSQSEAQEALKTQGEALQAEVEQVIASAQDADMFKASADAVTQHFAEQLNTAARFSLDVNGAYAQLMGSFYAVNAARLGVSPQELLQRYPLTIRAEALRGGEAALDQSADEYIAAINPEGRRIEEGGRPNLGMGDMYGMAPRGARQIAQGDYESIGRVRFVESGGDVYALAQNPDLGEEDVIGYAMNRGDRTELAVVAEAQGLGIGQELSYQYRSRNPYAPSGGLTEAGERTARKAFERMKTEGVLEQRTRGSFSPATSTIVLNKTADLSTFLHEAGHFYLETLADMAAQPDAPAEIQQDFDAVLKWFSGMDDAPAPGTIMADSWRAMTLDDQRFYHERFARGFEAYLFEGKAPSQELKGLFRRFRAWLLDVYRSALARAGTIANALDVQLSDDMRAVFNRMLATSQQIIQQERTQAAIPVITSAEEAAALGMSPDEWDSYQKLGVQATQEAIEGLEARSLRDMQWLSNAKDRTIRRLQAEARDKRKAIRDEVTAEVMAEPVNRARTFLKRGLDAEGQPINGPHKLSLPALRAMYDGRPAGLIDYQRLGYGRYGMLAEEGLAPDMVADMFGFPSGEDLIETLLNAEPAAEKIAGETDRRMLERYGDLTDRESIERAADEAIHNDARLRFVATEASALQKAVGQGRFLAAAAKDFAAGMVGRLAIKDLKPHRFRNAETRAAKAAEKAFKAGELATAAMEKRHQLINGYATRAAYDAQAEVQKGMNAFRRIVNAKDETTARNRDMDLVNAARGVLAAYGIGRADRPVAAYLETVKRLDPALYADIEPFLANAANNARDWRDMSYEEFQGLRTTVNQLWFLSKRVKQIEVDGELRDRETVTAELNARLDEFGVPTERQSKEVTPTDGERRLRMLSGLRASTRRVESWARFLDGSDSGPFRKYIWQMISEPADRYRTEKRGVMQRWLDIVRIVEPTLKPFAITAPELNGAVFRNGKAELLHAILHTGNESNKRKLLLGRGWATENADGSLDTARWDAFVARMIAEGRITKADYDFAQATWDLLDSLKEGAQRAHRTVYGRYFAEVTANPVDTPFGVYRGGYVPALTDTFLVQDAAINAEQDAIENGEHNMFPSPAKGFTQSRVDYNRELALDLRLIPMHLDKVLKFTHFAPPTRDVMRVLKDRGFSAKLNAFDPVAQTDMLLPWLNRAAKQIVETPAAGWGGKALNNVARTLRARTGMGVMFANFANAAQQLTGFAVTAVRVRPSLLASALWRYMRDPGAVTDAVNSASAFMAERNSTQMFEIGQTLDDILLNPNVLQKAQMWTARHGYFLQTAVQNVVDKVAWLGAYEQAIERGETEREAVRLANSVVRETQGSLSPEDISKFESGSAFLRLFTQFQSFFNMQANLLGTEFGMAARDLGLKKGAGRMFYVYLFGFMAPAVLAEAIVTATRGGVDDEDDDGYLDEVLAKFFESQARFGLAMVPGAGTLAAGVLNQFNDKVYDDRIATAPVVTSLESSVRAPKTVYEAIAADGDRSKALKDTLTAMTLLTGIPLQAASRPAGYLADVAEGDVEPTGPLDFARGLVSGAASPESRQ